MEQRPPEPPIPPDHQLPKSTTPEPAPAAPKKSRQWLWVILLLVFAGILFLLLRHHDDAGKKASGGGRHGMGGTVTATAAPAKQGDIGVYLDAIGTVTPVYTASIYNQVTGVVTAVHYREGQFVHKGDPLVDIDARQYQANVETAEGTLGKDQGLLAQAQMDLDRYQKAWAANAIAKQTLDDQEKLVAQDQAQVKSDQGTLDYDKVQLSYCHIVAPFNGRVGLRLVDPGNLMQSSGATELAVVTQMQPITVVFTVAQDELPQLLAHMKLGAGRNSGLSVDVFNRDSSQKLASGTLLAVDNQIDTTTGTVKLRAQFDNRDNQLFPNLFVNTRLLVSTQHNQTLVPDAAIQHNGDEAFVYALDPITASSQKDTAADKDEEAEAKAEGAGTKTGAGAGGKGALKPGFTARKQDVKVGISDNGLTAVEGINPGIMVATSSFEKMQPGSKVAVTKKPLAADTETSESNAP